MVEQCSDKCLQHAIDKNQRLIGEMLIKMIIQSKYTNAYSNDETKNDSNQQHNQNKNNNRSNKSNKRRKKGDGSRRNSKSSDSQKPSDKEAPKSKTQLKQLFKSLTKSTYQPRKRSSDKNSKTNSIGSSVNVGINIAAGHGTDSESDSNSDSDSGNDSGINSNTNYTITPSLTISSSTLDGGIHKISDDSLKNVLIFVNPCDIYFIDYVYWELTTTFKTTYTVSKRFNILLKQIHDNKNILHTIVPRRYHRYPIGLHMHLSQKIYYNYGHGLFFTLDTLYKLKQNEDNPYEDTCLEFQSPDGQIRTMKLNSFPWPLAQNAKNAHIVEFQEPTYNYVYSDRNDMFDTRIESDNQIFYQNVNFRKKIFCKQDLTKQTLTNFTPRNCFLSRDIKYNQSKVNSLVKDGGTDSDGYTDRTLIDINLQGLYNHYIFNKQTWKLYCGLSIAQIAIFLTKRKWVVAVAEDCDFVEDSQIQFAIDITDEVNAVKATSSNKKIRKLTIKNNNKADASSMDVIESEVNDTTLKRSNVVRVTHDNNESRYYSTFYGMVDDSCIIDLFGKRTRNKQHRSIYKRYYPKYGRLDMFYKYKGVEKFDIDKMYHHSILAEKNKRIAMEMKDIGYVLIDFIISSWDNTWTCGILMKYDKEEKTYVRHLNELKNHVGLLKLKTFTNIQDSYDSDQTSRISVVHLDNDKDVDYFGKRSPVQEQRNLIKMIFKHFDNVNHKKCKHLKKALKL